MQARLEDIAAIIHADPTMSEGFHEAALKLLGHLKDVPDRWSIWIECGWRRRGPLKSHRQIEDVEESLLKTIVGIANLTLSYG